MACGCNNFGNGYGNGWGGCGCNNTVQYAPSACNPNFPTTCTALGNGTIQRVVGEDSSYCKYTVPTLLSNSLLSYNQATGLVNWADGSALKPIFLGGNNGAIYPAQNIIVGNSYTIVSVGTTNFMSIGASANTVGILFTATGIGSGDGTVSIYVSNQVSSSTVGAIQGTTPTGQLVEFNPSTSTETQFPIVSPSGVTTTWGTIENIIPNTGVVYKSGSVVSQAALGTNGQVLTMVGGVPAFATPATNGFVDARSVNISYASVTSLTVNFGNLVVNSVAGNSIAINNSSAYTLNLSTNSLPNGLDTGSLIASTYYYVFAIYNSTTSSVATLSSLSPTAPTLPTGYTYFRLIGLFRTNSSSQIDALYNQNGRAVNLGQTANVVVTTQSTQASNKYWSGSVAYAPYQYVDKAFFRFSLVGASTTQTANVVISNTAAGSTGPTQTVLATTNEIYGAFIVAPYAAAGTNVVYGTTTVVVPNNTNSFFNIYTTAVLGTGDSFTLQISGYELSFL